MKKQLFVLIVSVISLLPAAATQAAEPFMLKDINPSGISNPLWLTDISGILFFQADDGINGPELWQSNGTEAGTIMVKDIYPGSKGSGLAELTNVNDTVFFRAADANGAELWKSDGTTAGTVMVKDIIPGSASSYPVYLTEVNGTLFFVAFDVNARDITSHCTLWKSDGTLNGTVIVKDIYYTNGTIKLYDIANLTNSGGALFFTAKNDANGIELWKSDGTEAGTALIKDIYRGPVSGQPYSSSPSYMTDVNGILFFAATDDMNGRELWKSNGTNAGTVMVKDICPGFLASSAPMNLTNVDGTLFFTANDGTNGQELWKSDGTVAGTVMVKDINSGSGSSWPWDLINANGTLFFRLDNGTNGDELWKSDGTEEGTVMVKDIRPGAPSSNISEMENISSELFFAADNGANGYELWQSNGTETGTFMISDIYPGSGSSWPSLLTSLGNSLFFSTNDFELWMHVPTDNDDCLDAVPIFSGQTIDGSNADASGAYSSSCAYNDTADVWFYFQPTVSDNYTIDAGSEEFDTTLAVFNACEGNELACNDDYLTTDSQIVLNMTEGKRYYIRVAGFDGQTGNFQLSILASCPQYAAGDINGDCRVDMQDFIILASEWLTCNLSPQELCQ